MDILFTLIKVLLLFVCVLIVFVVLMQRPKQEGLGAAFGGGITDSLLGAGTTSFLQKATVYMAVFYFLASTALAVLVAKKQRGDNAVALELESDPVPASVAPPLGGGPLEGLDLSIPPLELPGIPGEAPSEFPDPLVPLEGSQPEPAPSPGPEPGTGAGSQPEPGSAASPVTDPVPVPEPAPPTPDEAGADGTSPEQRAAGGEGSQ